VENSHALTARHACECVKEAFGGPIRKSIWIQFKTNDLIMDLDPCSRSCFLREINTVPHI